MSCKDDTPKSTLTTLSQGESSWDNSTLTVEVLREAVEKLKKCSPPIKRTLYARTQAEIDHLKRIIESGRCTEKEFSFVKHLLESSVPIPILTSGLLSEGEILLIDDPVLNLPLKPIDLLKEKERIVLVPSSKWQEFKQKYFPGWLKKVWKVKSKEVKIRPLWHTSPFLIGVQKDENPIINTNV